MHHQPILKFDKWDFSKEKIADVVNLIEEKDVYIVHNIIFTAKNPSFL